MRRRLVPVGIAVDRIVHQQVPGENFAEDPLPLVARPGDRLQRFDAGVVHDIEGHTEHLGDADGAVRRLALHLRRP